MSRASIRRYRAIALGVVFACGCGRATSSHEASIPERADDGGAAGATDSPAASGAGTASAAPDPTTVTPNPACPEMVPGDGVACNERGRVCATWGSCAPSCTCGPQGWKCQAPNCQPGCNYDDPHRKYYGKGGCESLDYSCPSGQASFNDRCGCGCILPGGGT